MGRIFTDELFDNGVSCLGLTRVEDLNIVRIRTCTNSPTFAVEYYYHTDIHPILVLTQLFDQPFTRDCRTSGVNLAQFWPGENNAVPIDNQKPTSSRH